MSPLDGRVLTTVCAPDAENAVRRARESFIGHAAGKDIIARDVERLMKGWRGAYAIRID